MPLEMIINDPVYLGAAVAGVAASGAVLVYKTLIEEKEEDTIEPEGMKKRLKKLFVNPTTTQGSKVGDYIKQRSTSNTPQVVGYAYKAKNNDVNVLKWVKDDKTGEETVETEHVQGTTYEVLEGNSKYSLYVKAFVHSITPGNFLAETYDVPKDLLMVGDENIWFDPKAHFVKFNGVKRHLSPKGMGRVWDSSFVGLTENYMTTLQDIPEQLQDLNNRVAGQKRIMNEKSKNIRKFKEGEERREKQLD